MHASGPTAAEIAGELLPWLERLAEEAFGPVTDRARQELRFGQRGSKLVDLQTGRWHDFEAGIGGDPLDLIRLIHGGTTGDAIRIARERFLGSEPASHPSPARASPPASSSTPAHGANASDDKAEKIATALAIWEASQPIQKTLGARYLVEVRGIPKSVGTFPHSLRWHEPKRMIVALMRDPVSDEPCGIHRTFLDADGRKIERKMLGRSGAIKLSPNDEVTVGLGITEGLEKGLSLVAIEWRPIWVCPFAGAISTFPVLPGIECLSIFSDGDAPGLRAADSCAQRWTEAGAKVFIRTPVERR
ncbi:MAG: DUF7146 domain-containing protein [Inquilinus sp.]|uniref:DUF7146 domain-containing protein n=1 Tax=Inquilinus sp. TaxID=1932117 RepID=UPI003F3CC498